MQAVNSKWIYEEIEFKNTWHNSKLAFFAEQSAIFEKPIQFQSSSKTNISSQTYSLKAELETVEETNPDLFPT
jgi:hypothetical protein